MKQPWEILAEQLQAQRDKLQGRVPGMLDTLRCTDSVRITMTPKLKEPSHGAQEKE